MPAVSTYVLIAGQSEALGFENTGPAPYTPTARVQIWCLQRDGSWNWNYMDPGVNTGTANNPSVWGPEVELANRWLAEHPTGVLWIVKSTHGSTGLAEDPAQLDWSPHSAGEMFDQTTALVDGAMANLAGGPYAFDHFDVLDWMQGESDAMDPAKAAAYEVNLREFITDARSAWHVEDVALGRIDTLWGDAASNFDVRVAQWDVAYGSDPMSDVVSFKTIGFETFPDGHFDAVGQVQLGDGFFDSWVI